MEPAGDARQPAEPAPVVPPPDDKDWTWTLTRRCTDCGVAVSGLTVIEVADRAEPAAVEWVEILTSSPAVDARPEPTVWSPLEYGAHVRDVYDLFDSRVAQMVAEDHPRFVNWDQDATATEQRYFEQDPDVVAAELGEAASRLCARLRSLSPADLNRPGQRSDGSDFTVTTLMQYFLHDVLHHLWDVTGQPDGVAELVDRS